MKRRLHDLGLGIRFALSGGREGWVRTLLTAVGVGLGVALLLGAASVPHLVDERADRIHDRQPFSADSGRNTRSLKACSSTRPPTPSTATTPSAGRYCARPTPTRCCRPA